MNDQVKKRVLDAIHSGTFYVQVAGSMDDPDIQEVSLEESSEDAVISNIAEALVLFSHGLFQYLMDEGYMTEEFEDADWKSVLEDFLDG